MARNDTCNSLEFEKKGGYDRCDQPVNKTEFRNNFEAYISGSPSQIQNKLSRHVYTDTSIILWRMDFSQKQERAKKAIADCKWHKGSIFKEPDTKTKI